MTTCKSPAAVVQAAFEVGRQLFADRPHKFGSHAFTQAQPFACLALREHREEELPGRRGVARRLLGPAGGRRPAQCAWDGAGVSTVVPPLTGRPSANPPAGSCRRITKELFATATVGPATCGQRWQVETANSMVKRNRSSALRARTPHRRSMEMLLRCVVHNIMVLGGTAS